jgi:hypothetical protein
MEKLKSCPLCGGKPEEKIVLVQNGFIYEIKCFVCGFGIAKRPFIFTGRNFTTPEKLYEELEELENQWNKRV